MKRLLLLLLFPVLFLMAGPLLAEPHFDTTIICENHLHLGLGEKQVVSCLGTPERKDKVVFEAATGEYIEAWHYPELGLKLELAGSEESGARTLYRIHADGPSRLRTHNGIRIGESRQEAVAKLKRFEGKGVSFQAGQESASVLWEESYQMLVVSFSKGKVSQIFLGPGPE